MRTPESHEKVAICRYLDANGIWYCKPYMAGYGKSGVPDILCCMFGVFASIEVKREGKVPTRLQEQRMKEIQNAGGLAFWGTAEKVTGEIERWMETSGTVPARATSVAKRKLR